MLANQARSIARKRGADAIINSRTDIIRYWRDALLRFKGDKQYEFGEMPLDKKK